MSRKIILSLVFILWGGFAFAQTLTWKNFSSMYNVNQVTVIQGKVWAATSGGVFSYSPLNGTFNQFTTTEGLSDIEATSIAADSGGAILIGEGNGAIDELDSSGHRLRSQQDIVKSSALSKQVTSMSLSGDTLFACTPFGVVVISRSSFGVLDSYTHFVPSQGSVQANGVALFDGNIYVGSQFGLSYAPQSGINLAAPDLWTVNDTLGLNFGVNALIVFNGLLMVGTNQGLYYSSDGRSFNQLSGIPQGTVSSLSESAGFLLVNTSTGLYKLNSVSSVTAVYNGGIQLSGAVAYSDTLLIGATDQGLLSVGSAVRLIPPPGPATNTISHLSVDASGNLWCATSLNDVGVAFMEFDGTTWRNYSVARDSILPSNTFFQISALCGGRVLAGSWGFGMALLQGDSMTVYNNSNSGLVGVQQNPSYVLVGDAVCDSSGDIWMTNPFAYNGNVIAAFVPAQNKWYTFSNVYCAPSKFVPIAIDPYGGIWTGDEYGDSQGAYHGLFYYNANGTLSNKADDISSLIDVASQTSGYLSDQVNAVTVDNEGQLWIGTTLGLGAIYDPNPAYQSGISSIYSMLDQDVSGIDYDALDHKWVSTATGVYVLSSDGNTRLAQYNTTNSPLPSDNVISVACDRARGIVYFATPYGVTELDMGIQQPQQNFSKLKIFPDPARIPSAQPIQIVGLVANSQIKIFSVDGRLVDEFQAQGGKIAYWNGTDGGGKLLPSGIYIVVAYSSDGSQSTVAKMAIIRQ
ncbi:MAG: hypothetical protein M1378_08775 [Bacteroidetes bacterium]|nr:hypothetical protein [Bacteroidota bacterium]MCL5034930.1 hypothetical protein [Bacteroidota bacterium]